MADDDGDSHMASTPSPPLSDNGLDGATSSSILSPPGSQQQAPTAVSAPSVPSPPGSANANGKRPIQTISNGTAVEPGDGGEDSTAPAPAPASAAMPPPTGAADGGGVAGKQQSKQDFLPRIHQASGYTWSHEEDQPSYGWNSPKAVGEATKAWEGMVHKEFAVNNRYGDPFELADKERAVLNSLSQR
ncbi:hypothetical protein LTR08_006453 [Meristemomyces frigidus]|nr:hypothetical protein LTR08_006453 [Meristemomyces frigidus]